MRLMKYLSDAAALALDDDDDEYVAGIHDDDDDDDDDVDITKKTSGQTSFSSDCDCTDGSDSSGGDGSVPVASPPSSPRQSSSPSREGSVVGCAVDCHGDDRGVIAMEGSISAPSHLAVAPPWGRTSSGRSGRGGGAAVIVVADPYADVRERMEALRVEQRSRPPPSQRSQRAFDPHRDITTFAAITTYLGYIVLIVTGHVRDVCAGLFRKGRYRHDSWGRIRRMERDGGDGGSNGTSDDDSSSEASNSPSDSPSPPPSPSSPQRTCSPSNDRTIYAPLLKSWENFYTRRLYHRIQDCFSRPVSSRPSAVMSVLERISYDGNKTLSVLDAGDAADRAGYVPGGHSETTPDGRAARRCLNLGSYNYLGFADDWDETCRESVIASLDSLPSSCSSPRAECGTSSCHREVERTVASFVGKEDAVVLNMGFNVNAAVIPALASHGDLLVSDEMNHTSIVNGARASGASIRTFRHDDASDLESVLREAICCGQPRTRRPWNRIIVVVEGIYSMEGERCDLRGIVAACKKYGAYVYLDEAHSIGALGATGRGLCEYEGVDPGDVDILMGTFTKSFGGMGGYVAASRDVVDHLRRTCAGYSYHNSLSPVVCQQIVTSFRVIMGEDGTDVGKRKLDALRDNSNYFRMRLADMGLHVLGHYDSPIVPVMLYNPTKIAAFSRECLKRGLAVVVVGFPAVPILMSRARICVSAGHTREQLDGALEDLEEIADLLKLRYARSTFG